MVDRIGLAMSKGFKTLKEYLSNPSILQWLDEDLPLLLYLIRTEIAIGMLLAQENVVFNNKVTIVDKLGLFKHLMSQPILDRRISRWPIQTSEFHLDFQAK